MVFCTSLSAYGQSRRGPKCVLANGTSGFLNRLSVYKKTVKCGYFRNANVFDGLSTFQVFDGWRVPLKMERGPLFMGILDFAKVRAERPGRAQTEPATGASRRAADNWRPLLGIAQALGAEGALGEIALPDQAVRGALARSPYLPFGCLFGELLHVPCHAHMSFEDGEGLGGKGPNIRVGSFLCSFLEFLYVFLMVFDHVLGIGFIEVFPGSLLQVLDGGMLAFGFGRKRNTLLAGYLLQLLKGFAMVGHHSLAEVTHGLAGALLLSQLPELHFHHAALGGFRDKLVVLVLELPLAGFFVLCGKRPGCPQCQCRSSK